MPWKTEYLRDQRWRFLKLWLSRKTSVVELCRRVKISRKTAYKWMARFKQEGRRGLHDRSRRPGLVHNRPDVRWLARLRQARLRHPSWGPKKLCVVLQREQGKSEVASVAAIGRWLRSWSLSERKPRRGARRGPLIARPHLTIATKPNEVWSVDYKGWFRTADGTRVDPLTVQDMASRFLVAFELLRDQTVKRTKAAFVQIFIRRGLPSVIRVDNGSPFGADGALGLTRLSVWWTKLGIRVEFITPGCPGENAAHEQMHGVYKSEEANPPARTLRAQKRRSSQWVRRYNEVRPHEGLAMRCPAQVYRKSTRKMPSKLPALIYPREWSSRLVRSNGMISLNGRGRFVGEAFEGERIGLKHTCLGWDAYFGKILIGTLSAKETTGIRAVRYRSRSKRA